MNVIFGYTISDQWLDELASQRSVFDEQVPSFDSAGYASFFHSVPIRVYASFEALSLAPQRRYRAKTRNKSVLSRTALSVRALPPSLRTAFVPVFQVVGFVWLRLK
jgi:hypothetical protein